MEYLLAVICYYLIGIFLRYTVYKELSNYMYNGIGTVVVILFWPYVLFMDILTYKG